MQPPFLRLKFTTDSVTEECFASDALLMIDIYFELPLLPAQLVSVFSLPNSPPKFIIIGIWMDLCDEVPEHGGARRLFNFLPLHAAGEYSAKGKHYISSYTPSLTALMRAPESHDRSLSVPFTAIGQNRPAGALFASDGVELELELVRRLLPPPQLFPS
ncbi:uncharacterized protein F5891DRAFT_1282653 [Suillus fuscotomentosus]|uniref:Uncharacterized protein n=1 Tax=Suillus fuscotomentosus TaxID=1912939 RepID=A0AAD4DS96_9AGAM|nr:uncharacterized protein F5891DRAFT_1282653 [Suillus fuscotomentosus]KAG1890514.1 hypothetical protein F5891DRAFT_1282653 [Suillus fuscotomentosus]